MSSEAPSNCSDLAGEARDHPGTLVLIVGPSGAGKDTLIDGARRIVLSPDARSPFYFPRRAIDRAAHASEDFIPVPSSAFEDSPTGPAFALQWSAHGTRYGIPISIVPHLASGGVVVVNVSRTVVEKARATFARVVVVNVTCPPEIRARRLAERGRETDREIGARMARTISGFDPALVDYVIDNSGAPEEGIAKLVEILNFAAATSVHERLTTG